MSQNYNVDDILEEIRRKKARQPDAPSTYDMPDRASYQEEAPSGMPNLRPIGTRRTKPQAQTSRNRPRPSYDDSGWDNPREHRQPAEPEPRRVKQPSPGAQASRVKETPKADNRMQTRRPEEPVRRKKTEAFRGAQPEARPKQPAPRAAYDMSREPRRYDPPQESRKSVRRTQEYSDFSQQEPEYGRPEPVEAEPFRQPYGSPPASKRRAAQRPRKPEPNYSDYPDYLDELQAGRLPEEDYPPEDYGYDGERFEDDMPVETPTEDFSIHFNLDDEEEGAPSFRGSQQEQARDDEESLVRSRWHQSFLEQAAQEDPAPDDDFASPDDEPYVEKDLKKLRTGLILRTFGVGILTLITVYMAFSIKYPPFGKLIGLKEGRLLWLPFELIYPDVHPRVFMVVMMLLCAAGALVCSNIIGTGLGALFRLRANSDTPAALAVLAVLVQGVVLTIYSTYESNQLLDESVSVYIPVAMLVLLFTLIGKWMLAGRIWRNFKFLTSDKEKYAMLSVFNKDFARELSRGLGPEVDEVVYSAQADFITGFLSKSYTGDYSDNFYCVAAPVGFAGAILVGGLTGFLAENPVLAVSAFAATMCICAPLSSAIVPHLMLGRMSKWLCKRGAMLAGYETAEELSSAGAVVIDEKDVFPGESVQLHGMKVFAEKRIDEAILDAASVILSCNGLMSGVFLNMIGGNQRLLKKVDGLIYEDGMGVSAWVDSKRVLIGSRELMQNHEVECPSRDFETRYTRGGRRVLYIANSGELSAMFVVSYNGETRTAERLLDLERRGVAVILYTTDPNVTSELVASVFGIRKGSVRVLPAKLHPEYNYLTRYRDRVTAGCAHQGGLAGVLQLLRASASVCHSVRTGAITQLVGIIVGYGLMVTLAFTKSLPMASFYMLIIYGFCALAVTFLVSNFGKM